MALAFFSRRKPIALIIVATLFISACDDTPDSSQHTIRPVKYLRLDASHSGVLRDRVFNGIVRAQLESTLSFRVAGTIEALPINVGDYLEQHQVMARLDDSYYQLAVFQAHARLAQSKAERRQTDAEYMRIRQLYTNDNASKKELDHALAQAETSNALYNEAKQSLDLAELNLSYTALTSPAACRVAQIHAEVNENIAVGQALVAVNCGHQWEVHIDVPESLISLLTPGLTATIRFDAIPDGHFKATISEVGIGSQRGAIYPVTLVLEQAPPEIRSGFSANVRFSIADDNRLNEQFYLPAMAVVKRQHQHFVYVLKDTQHPNIASVHQRAVEIGELSTAGLLITQGLVMGDRVVTAGINSVRIGQHVRIDGY